MSGRRSWNHAQLRAWQRYRRTFDKHELELMATAIESSLAQDRYDVQLICRTRRRGVYLIHWQRRLFIVVYAYHGKCVVTFLPPHGRLPNGARLEEAS